MLTWPVLSSISAWRNEARYPAGECSASPSLIGGKTKACPGRSTPPFPCNHTRAVFPAAHRRLKPFGIGILLDKLASRRSMTCDLRQDEWRFHICSKRHGRYGRLATPIKTERSQRLTRRGPPSDCRNIAVERH